MRADLDIIADWIEPESRVLDLGCGDGSLMAHLARERQVHGYGLEIDLQNIRACIRSGVNVIQTNLDKGLGDFDDNSFDYVIMTEALQVMRRPDLLVEDMLRIGRRCLVTFPNFGHWRCRVGLGFRGRMPVSRTLPDAWYDTPNIHLCTVADFESFCAARQIQVLQRSVVDQNNRSPSSIRLLPNLFGEIALYKLCRKS